MTKRKKKVKAKAKFDFPLFYTVGTTSSSGKLKPLQTLPVFWVSKDAKALARELTKVSGTKFEAMECRVYDNGKDGK